VDQTHHQRVEEKTADAGQEQHKEWIEELVCLGSDTENDADKHTG
jgi:hypothetical protein